MFSANIGLRQISGKLLRTEGGMERTECGMGRMKPSLSASTVRSATGSSAYGAYEDIIRSRKEKPCSRPKNSSKSLQLPVT